MANISVYDPFGTRLNKVFNELFWRHPALQDEKEAMKALQIKLDVSEDDKGYSVRADMPGIKKEDISVNIDGNQVTISAETKCAKEEKKDANLIYSERYEGRVYRSFTLDSSVDESKAAAKYADGVLELTLPKKGNEANSKKLTIQ